MYLYKYFFFFVQTLLFKKFPKKIYLLDFYFFSKEEQLPLRINKTNYLGKNLNLLFFKKIFFFFLNFVQNNFNVGYNLLFVDHKCNFNYIPVTNKTVFSRSLKDLYKYIKMFNINVVLLMDAKKKKIIFRRLTKFNLIHVSSSSELESSNLDLNLKLGNSPVINYILYLSVLNAYLLSKNRKNLR